MGIKLKSSFIHCILFYGMRQYFSTPDIMTPDASGKLRGCRKIIKLDDRATPSLNLKGKTEVISPVLWLTSVFWRTLIKIFVFSIFKQVFSQEINVFLFGHSVFSREVY